MPLKKKISGLLQITENAIGDKLSGVLQILMNALTNRNIWSTPDINEYIWRNKCCCSTQAPAQSLVFLLTNLVPAWRPVEVALTAPHWPITASKIWDEDENEDENTQVTYRDPGSRRIQKFTMTPLRNNQHPLRLHDDALETHRRVIICQIMTYYDIWI